MRSWVVVLVVALVGCGQRANLGGDGGQSTGADGSTGTTGRGIPNKCHGSPAAATLGTQPDSCSHTSECAAPAVCFIPPGTTGTNPAEAGVPNAGFCVPPCQSDCDCPAWLSCKGGSCSQCKSCGPGETCTPVAGGGGVSNSGVISNASCGQGAYFKKDNGCTPYEVCAPCLNACPTCTSNTQCAPGDVCVGGSCQGCTADSQCGPNAKCAATHVGVQCTCSTEGDCVAGEQCAGGICAPSSFGGCQGPVGRCANGEACVNGTCRACTSFVDCNGPMFFGRVTGLACIEGVCTNCTANSQCGGGQTCVGGTCGTCITNDQCGPSGQCTDGFCTCTKDAQCAAGQRCGSGVCVEM